MFAALCSEVDEHMSKVTWLPVNKPYSISYPVGCSYQEVVPTEGKIKCNSVSHAPLYNTLVHVEYNGLQLANHTVLITHVYCVLWTRPLYTFCYLGDDQVLPPTAAVWRGR